MSAYEIYLLRHGETEWNASGRFQGKLDSPLTEMGVAQAKACGRKLFKLGITFDAVQSSPLGRTRQTTAILVDCIACPEPGWEPRLEEVTLGSWDGLTHYDIDAQWPGFLDGSTPFDWYFRSPDGEAYDAARWRVMEWLGTVRGTVLAVSHGLIGRIIRGTHLKLRREEALSLPVPQDLVWRLTPGRIDAV